MYILGFKSICHLDHEIQIFASTFAIFFIFGNFLKCEITAYNKIPRQGLHLALLITQHVLCTTPTINIC